MDVTDGFMCTDNQLEESGQTHFVYNISDLKKSYLEIDPEFRDWLTKNAIPPTVTVDFDYVPTRLLWPRKISRRNEIMARRRGRRRFLRGRFKRLRRYRVSRGGTRL